MTTVKLSNGIKCPIIGLGTYNTPINQIKEAINAAISVGYRHIDCAHYYNNEKEIGSALGEHIDKGVARSDLFITSKLWNTFHRQDLVEPALKTSLRDLNLNYLDLYLMHWPTAYKEGNDLNPSNESGQVLYSDVGYLETWQAMEECVKKGLTKSIGLSNFNKRQIKDILNICDIKPVVNQIESHPYFNQNKLIDYCSSEDIIVTAYSPLGAPQRGSEIKLLEDAKIKSLAEKYKKTTAQVLIRYQIERNVIVIPKSANADRIKSNFDVFDFCLSKEDMECLNSLDKGSKGRLVNLPKAADHKDYPFKDLY